MKTINGNLIALAKLGKFDVIVHGCNCFCTMGVGIAKSIKEAFSEAYYVDTLTSKGDRSKLGQISYVPVVRGDMHDQVSFTVVNGYTQFDYRGVGVKADYEAIRNVFRTINEKFKGLRIGYPKIGAGYAGGDWDIIAKIINEELTDVDHTLVIFDK